jgi:hypothetical protein
VRIRAIQKWGDRFVGDENLKAIQIRENSKVLFQFIGIDDEVCGMRSWTIACRAARLVEVVQVQG